LEIVKTEPVTSFFAIGESDKPSRAVETLQPGADYCFRVHRTKAGDSEVSLEKDGGIWVPNRGQTSFRASNGELISVNTSDAT